MRMAASNKARAPKNPLSVEIMRSTKMESSTRSPSVRGSISATSGLIRPISRRMTGAGRTDGDDLRSQRGGAVHLDLGRVARHYNDRLHSQGACRIGHSLRVIAAGIGDRKST